jgi:alcohol dehydrogenase class IV
VDRARIGGLARQELTIGSAAKTTFGAGSIARLPDAVKSLGASRAFLVTDAGLVAGGIAGGIATRLGDAGLEVVVYSELRPNPAIEDIAAGASALRRFGQSVVVGLGGGTSLDGAKGISLAAANDVPVRDLDYRNQRVNPGLPVIAVPTTAGTGSETNSFGVIEDHEAGRKFYIGNPSVQPRVVILDPELTAGLPPAPTAATGVDALTHALESLMARQANPFSHGVALEVIRSVHTWLPVAVESGEDLEARAQMLLAAHLAGLAFANTGLGLAHALAHTLSAMLGTVHGVALAVVLPAVLEFNLSARRTELDEAAQVMGVHAADDNGPASAAIQSVAALRKRLRMASTLTEVGLEGAMVARLVDGALDDVVLANNPVQPERGQLEDLVRSLL